MIGAPLFLAIDAGTGSCRAAVFDRQGTQVALVQREWRHAPEPGVPGSQVFDTNTNWTLICECVRGVVDAVGDPGRIAAVSSTSMREGMVLYDEEGAELWACPNVDARVGEEATRLIESGLADRIYRTGGDWVSITAPARFLWLAKHRPQLLQRTAHVGMLSDWVCTRLAGGFATEPTVGSSSGMFDLERRSWASEIIDALALPEEIFPPVVDPGTVIGEVGAAASTETGLLAGTPVVAGGADTQLGLLGIGQVDAGAITIIGGTFWQQTAVVDRALIDSEARLRTLCHVGSGLWMIEGIGFYSGLVMRWFRDAFFSPDAGFPAAPSDSPYMLMEELAAALPPGANGLFGVFSNVMNARRWAHGPASFVGFDVTDPQGSGTAACVRAIEESAAFVSRAHVATIAALTGYDPDVVVFTGGASKGSLWPQILADVIGVRVEVPAVTESSALGAALLAQAAVEAHEVSGLARTHARIERVFEPRDDERGRYDELYERWRAVNEALLSLVDAGTIEPLWRAAGT